MQVDKSEALMVHVSVSEDILSPIQGSEYYWLVMLRHVSEVMLSVCNLYLVLYRGVMYVAKFTYF